MRSFILTLIFSFITSFSCLCAGVDIPDFQFKKYQVNDGLSENTVFCIMQDKKGFIWLGTKDGLNKFDGVNFTVYRQQQNKNSIGNNYVKSIIESSDDKLYVGTDDGVYIMNRIDETFIRLEETLNIQKDIITSVTHLTFDQYNRLWIACRNDGVYIYDPAKEELKSIQSTVYDLTKTTTWTIHEDNSGEIWIGTRIGLLKYNPVKDLLEPIEGLIELKNNGNKEILTIFESDKDKLWLGTWNNGIIQYDKRQKKYSSFYGLKDRNLYITHIRAFLQYDVSNLLIGADDGLYLFNILSGECSRLDIPYDQYSLGDQNVYCMTRDREGCIWIGTYFGGLNYLNTSTLSIERYLPDSQKGHLSGKAVSQFCEDEKGNLWIATEDGGLNYFNTKTKEFTQPVKTSYHNIHPVLLIGDELWIGTFSRGLDIYNTQTKTIKNYRSQPYDTNSLDDDCIFSLYQTKKGDIYVGTSMGLNKFNPEHDNFTRIGTDSITFVYDIKEDKYHNLWIASYNTGIIQWNAKTNKWIHYNDILNKEHPAVNMKATGIYIDNQERLWISSEGRGIFLYNYENDQFLQISEKDGLPNDVIYGILDDSFGNIWVSSNKGLASFAPNDLSSIKRFSAEDGLQSNEFNYKASFKSSDGKLYFGGINGFNCFYPQDLSENLNQVIPHVEITGMQLLGEDTDKTNLYIQKCLNKKEPIRLQHFNSSFSISYISLSYIAQSKNQYAYMLEGIDTDWNMVGNTRSVTYLNLPPGQYTFKVKASNNHDIWNTSGAELNFEIMPPFWLSASAKIIYIILLSLVLYGIILHFIKKNKIKQQKQLETYKTEQEKLAFKSKIEFFTNIAHEIRTPVSLIKAPLEEIILSNDGNENTKRNLSLIEKNSERLSVLINQLLDFRKMDAKEYTLNNRQLNITKLLTELYENFRKTAQNQNINLELILPDGDNIQLISDPDALTKIISNFLTNALKHTKNEVILKLSINHGNSYTISVADNGNGIPESYKERIFDPFFQMPSTGNKSGTGIGLFFTQYLSEKMGGTIQVTDNPQGGSVFSFTFKSLPETELNGQEEHQEKHTDTQAEEKLYQNEKKTILIVEDHPDMLLFIENSLKAEYNTNTAENARKALTYIDQKAYDLIISDIMMPDINGLEFVAKLRNDINYSHIPIILLSAKTDNQTKIEGLNAGADVFIEKPFSTSYLKAQISSLLANRQAILEAFNRSPLTSYSILATNKSDMDFINKLNDEIDKHISDSNFSIEQLTDQLFISRSNLQRKLKSICNVTPGDYLRTYRLKKAATLLLEKGLRINEVAFETGFSSPSYFTKCFVKQFGMLPKDFIKSNGESKLENRNKKNP